MRVALALAALSGCTLARDPTPPDGPSLGGTWTPPTTPRLPLALRGRFEVRRNVFGTQRMPWQTLLGDCNGDGLLDAFRPYPGKIHVQGAGGAFSETQLAASGTAGAMVDVDGDGKVDILVADADLQLLRGRGDCTFEPLRSLGVACAAGGAVQIVVTDVDLDGVMDFAVACRAPGSAPLRVLLGRGDGTYEPYEPPATPLRAPPADDLAARGYKVFGAFFEDFDGDGVRDLAMMIDTQGGWFARGQSGLSLGFLRDEDFTASFAPVDPMGLTLIDFDRDGHLDFFVSGSRLYRKQEDGRYLDVAYAVGVGRGENEVTDYVHWSPFALDVNLDGWSDLLVARKGGPTEDMAYPIWPSLFINRGDGTFTDVGRDLIALTVAPEMMVCGDLASDGRVGCFLGDPGGTSLIVNRVEPEGGFVGARLRGTISSPDASGAVVALEGATPPLVVYAGGQSPVYGEHARDPILATGARASVTLVVRWPSGLRQRVPDLAVGRYHAIVEPAAFALSARVAPADGAAMIDVSLDPAAAGAATASVELEGDGRWAGPAAMGVDGKLHRSLVAPSAEGVARLTISLDGLALRVRPKVRFGAADNP